MSLNLKVIPARLQHMHRIKWAGIALATAVFAFAFTFRILPRVLPYAGQEALDNLAFSRVILDAEGGELQVLPLENGLRRIRVPLSAVPWDLVDIVVRAEDKRFFLHPGFDLPAFIRAAMQYARAGKTVSGASTISMQAARLLVPRTRSLSGKLGEAWEALQLESRVGKRGVLDIYLNLLPFGQNTEGFGTAARVFYGKPLSSLTRSQLMTLAVIPRGPTRYDPYRNPQAVCDAALRLAALLHYKEDPGIDQALQSVLDPGRPGIWPFRAPQFVRWLTCKSEFSDHKGREPIRTGIEPKLQAAAETLLGNTVAQARGKRISNGAAIFVRPQGMSIAAWVGSVDFFNEADSGQVDGVTMRRQPGSTLKPFLYALALERGFTASSVLPDIPTDFGGAEVYVPSNYNNQFNGPVRLRQAIASSLNVPAVYVLERIGVQPFVDLLISNGFTSLEDQRGNIGLGLALGNAEVSLFELVQGYGIFLQNGEPAALNAGTGEKQQKGKGEKTANPLIDERVSVLIRDMLTRHPDRTLVFGRPGTARRLFRGALKTGTSNQFNNIWAVGFTPDLLGGVWMGNFSGDSVIGKASSGYPAEVVATILDAYSNTGVFSPPEGLENLAICSLSGLAATDSCPHAMGEWFLPGTAPLPCDWHYKDSSGIRVSYPQEYREWLSRYRYRTDILSPSGNLAIKKPLDGSLFFLNSSTSLPEQSFAVEATGNGAGRLLCDGITVFRGNFPIKVMLPLQKGSHELELRQEGSSDAVDLIRYEVR